MSPSRSADRVPRSNPLRRSAVAAVPLLFVLSAETAVAGLARQQTPISTGQDREVTVTVSWSALESTTSTCFFCSLATSRASRGAFCNTALNATLRISMMLP